MEKLNASAVTQIEKIIERHRDKKGPVKLMLHDVQHELGYIPFKAMEMISKGCNIPIAEVYGVVTFYTQFTTEPRGKHVINVCLGTACYVKGSQPILNRICDRLQCKVNETTSDGMYSIDATRCIGACGLAPVLTVNDEVYGRITVDDVDGILNKYMN